jgi:hypothetical protein
MQAANQQPIYLDFNASTPLAPEVAKAMEQVTLLQEIPRILWLTDGIIRK